MAGQNTGAASGEFLLTAGTALAIRLSQQLTAEEVELLAAFLEVLGDQLELLALNMPREAGRQARTAPSANSSRAGPRQAAGRRPGADEPRQTTYSNHQNC